MSSSTESLMYSHPSMTDESERSCDPRQWTSSASSNARRRAQNRVAQRSHRERTKRRIEELEEQLSLCLNPETFPPSSGAGVGSRSHQHNWPTSKPIINVNSQYEFSELDAWMENSSSNDSQSHQASQGDVTSPEAFNSECSTLGMPTSGSPVEVIERTFPESSMHQLQHHRSIKGENEFDVANFGGYITPPATIICQPELSAQPSQTHFSQEMATDIMTYQGLDVQYPFYPAELFSDPPGAPAVPQHAADVLPVSRYDPSVLTPQDRQEQILHCARAAGYSNFDAAVVDYYTGCFDEGSTIRQAQKASRSTRLRGVLGNLSGNTQDLPASDVSDNHVEIRQAAEMLCKTDMAGLVDNSQCGQDVGSDSSGRGSSRNTERKHELPTVFQHQAANLWALLSQLTRRSERDVRDTSSPVACAILLLAWARESHDLETPRMTSLLRLIQDSVPLKE